MPDNLKQLTDLIAEAYDLADIQPSDLLQDSPLVAALPMTESSNGTVHKWVKEVQAPVVGFRSVNAGRDLDHSVDQEVSASLVALDWSSQLDVAYANASRRGKLWEIAREALRHFRSALSTFEEQLINGRVGASVTGFEGFRDAATIDAANDEMVVNAGGVAGDLATLSSVYAIRAGLEDVVSVYKGDGVPLDVGETQTIKAVDDEGKSYPAYYTPATAWLGLQVSSAFSIGRIANIADADGKRLNDDLIYKLLSKFPAGRQPTHLVMSRRSRELLRSSRTATNGTGVAPPIPDSVAGIPIVVSDAVKDTETAIA